MRDRLIRWLGGFTRDEHDALISKLQLSEHRESQMVDPCTKTENCWMREGHGGGCREWHGLCFSTGHQKELASKRKAKAHGELTEAVEAQQPAAQEVV